MSTNLEELKKLREKNFLKHKQKKRAYYLKSKNKSLSNTIQDYKAYDYSKELNNDNFQKNIKNIAKKQKEHIDDRKEQILKKINEYKQKKQEYYKNNKEKRLNYDKEYREKKKEELKNYRKEYYQKNKERILERQKEKRKKERE